MGTAAAPDVLQCRAEVLSVQVRSMIGKLALTAVAGGLTVAIPNGRGADGGRPRARLLGKQESWDYAPAMWEVAKKFTGRQGVVLHLGDSITYASPYTAWARRGKGKTREDEEFLRWSHCGERNNLDGWYLASVDVREGRSYTAAGGVRSDQYLAGGHNGLASLDEMIRKYNPQMAVVMLGTNNAWQGRGVASYRADMEKIVSRLLGNGTIVVLSTIPPLTGNTSLVRQYNDSLWELAEGRRLPVIDYHGEILARRPGTTWDGTLLEKGDAHPTASRAGVTPESRPTPRNLRESGYLLRGWLSVKKLAEVKRRVVDDLGR